MTTLALAHKKMVSLPLSFPIRGFPGAFFAWNKRGIVTLLLLVAVGSTAVGYLAALYWALQFGLAVEKGKSTLDQLTEHYVRVELSVRQKESTLAGSANSVLPLMEKVSTITYVTPEAVVVLEPHIRY